MLRHDSSRNGITRDLGVNRWHEFRFIGGFPYTAASQVLASLHQEPVPSQIKVNTTRIGRCLHCVGACREKVSSNVSA
jgi:hypothetical protein